MIVRSRIVDLEACARIAKAMECELYGKCESHTMRDGRIKSLFTLRPCKGSDKYRAKNGGRGFGRPRRVWAVDWQGHYVFMRAIYALDPAARVQSAVADYHSLDDFKRLAFDTGYRNVGSQMFPEYAIECSVNNEDMDIEDLVNAAYELANLVTGITVS